MPLFADPSRTARLIRNLAPKRLNRELLAALRDELAQRRGQLSEHHLSQTLQRSQRLLHGRQLDASTASLVDDIHRNALWEDQSRSRAT